MRLLTVVMLITLTGCSMKQWYPMGGAIVGGATGSLGGPLAAGAGAGLGYSAGVIAENGGSNSELKETVETLEALSEGDVKKLLELKMEDHQSGFEEFTSTIKKILMAAACFLGIYLLVPILVARRCSKNEAEKHLTRAPFPNKTTGQNK